MATPGSTSKLQPFGRSPFGRSIYSPPVPRPPHLPDYERPPIDEVAIGLQFSGAISGFTDAHAGLFWQTVQERYPKAESQPRVESQPEVLEGGLQLQTPPLPLFVSGQGGRTFLISEDDSYLLQIQNNRFYRNWRRREDEYPHFDELQSNFGIDYAAFCAFLADEELQAPVPLQADVTYINWITDLRPVEFLRSAANVSIRSDRVDDQPQDQTWTARYLVRDANEVPVARLHVQCVPGVRASPTGPVPGSQLSLMYLSPWRNDDLNEVFAIAREVIVQGFTDITTEAAHRVWRRVQ